MATYKQGGENKVEIFYFLPAAWLNRAIGPFASRLGIRLTWYIFGCRQVASQGFKACQPER
jgi:hypothetical protein